MLLGLALIGAAEKLHAADLIPREQVWAALQAHAKHYRIEPAFIYALVAAESNFNAAARNGDARGLLQLTPAAWRTVTSQPYEANVWEWRANLRTGVDYLAYCRHALHEKKRFSYPLLLAAFHYGLDAVAAANWDAGKFAPPDNAIYRELWRGNLAPAEPPATKRM
ncbi:MAG TPA: transglycosylase SLT domain-containing protein [Candidatus Didemnitutus sp.]|nr:transglycosylase SLT domain-containing protein [Candidatus Didemnitutus sp.]